MMRDNARTATRTVRHAPCLLLALLFGWAGPTLAQPAFPDIPELPDLPDVPWDIPGDMDGDGYRSDHLRRGTDCDDTDPAIYPGATEICDGTDQDCDGEVDEDAGSSWYPDEDGDGWGAVGVEITACLPEEGYTDTTGDCDDQDPAIHPGALELMDLLDQNCNGYIDETTVIPSIELERLPSTAPRVLGDINGDGYDDFVVTGTTANLFLGGPRVDTDLDAADAAVRMDPAICEGQPGLFTPLGDLDGDGFDDFGYLCRSESGYTGTFLNVYAGRARFTDFDLSQITSCLVSPSADQAITTVAGYAGDLNQDGYDDLVLGLAYDSSGEAEAGRVVVHYGGSTWWPLDTSAADGDLSIAGWAGQHFGVLAENVGDLDHDGFDEIAIADAPSSGRQRLYLFAGAGRATSPLTADDAVAVLYSSTYEQGLYAAFAGDLTGDGTDDLVLSDGYSLFMATSESGAWYLDGIMAPLDAVADVQYTLADDDPEWYHHVQLLSGGDINGDGHDDLIVGTWGGHTTEALAYGSVSVILGVPAIMSESPWPSPSGSAGMCTLEYCLVGSPGTFHGAGDFNGDGRSDFLVGAQEDSTAVVLGP